MRKAAALSIAVAVLLVSGFAPAFAQPAKGPYVDQVRFIHYEDENVALEQVRSGSLDAYYFKIPLEAAADAKDDPRIKIYDRLSGSNVMMLNPAPYKDDRLNPFQFRDVRYAMNYLIDRDLVVNEFHKGYGSPLVEPFGIYSPEYLNIIETVESMGLRYNPQLADSMITKALTQAGAAKDDGRWMYGGKQVEVKVLIRSDDTVRRLIGDDFAAKLESAGFSVQKDYGDLSKANTVVYGTDPQDHQWDAYTEGFAGTSVFVKYNPVIPAQMYAPWYGRMPGFQNPSFWQYENATLDEVTQRIFFADFKSEEERNELVNEAVTMGMQEAVRVFVNQKTDPHVAKADLQGLVNDFGAGITSKYSLINARPAQGSSLDVGVKQIHQGPWNSVGGLSDIYSRDIYFLVIDSGTFRDPYTGEIVPIRTDWTDIKTEGPDGKLAVPEEAVTWDPATQEWANPAGEATSAVTFDLVFSNWHNGQPMSAADVMYAQYFTFEWGTDLGPGDMTVDPEFTSLAGPALERIKGLRFIDSDTAVSYVDFWHYDPSEIADFATAWATEPWEITAATERLVTSGKIAYSRAEATVKNVDWLDMVVPDHAKLIRDELVKMRNERFVPAPLQGMVSESEAISRYNASIDWIDEHDHAVIGNGAFYFDSYNVAGRTITVKAFRDPTYPFEVGHWSGYETPRLAKIASSNIARTITIGQPAQATLNIEVGGEPSSEAQVDYFISNKDGRVVVRGSAQATDTGRFVIDIPAEETSKLSAGPNQLKIFANSDFAFSPDISTTTILASSTGSTGGQTGGNQTGGTTPETAPSGCLIATAAFGSELTPQVQYLRSFRQDYILSTASGSAFMNAFNAVYYSFSPQVADYERDQPWLQATVKAAIYPLFGILGAAERVHAIAAGGEAGAVAAGAVASSLIGAVYLWPAGLARPVQKRSSLAIKMALAVLAASAIAIAIGIATANTPALVAGTSLFVLSAAGASAMAAGRLVGRAIGRKVR
ncbi:MAG: ABC transporter substrate-binding protein [Nitrososphaera sp.]